MTPEALSALQESIRHWEQNTQAKTIDDIYIGADYCALCKLYLDTFNCDGCPVYETTAVHYCGKTPFEDVSRSRYELPFDLGKFIDAAHKELAFLKSLLPPIAKEP